MKRIALLALFACVAASGALAASSEPDYLAARDKYIAKIRSMEKAKADDDEVFKQDETLRADLEKRLTELLGDLSVKGYPAKGKINLETLSDSGVGFGMLDGLNHSAGDEGPQIVITTPGLLQIWLKAKSREKDKALRLPAEMDAALRLDRFFTFAIGSDAAFTKSAALDVTKPDDVDFLSAQLGGWSQDIGPFPADQIVVTLRKGDKVYIASARTKTEAKIDACEAIWTKAQREAEKLQAAYVGSNLTNTKLSDQRSKVEEKGDKDYHACFVEHAPREKFYPTLVKEAQALADRIAGK